MKKLRKKLYITLAMILLAFMLTIGTTYAWWNTLQSTQQAQVELGEGDTLIVSEEVSGSGILIPETETPTGSEVTSVTYDYAVSVNQEAVEAGTTSLTVSTQNIQIGGDTTHADLVNITITPDTATLSETPTTIQITITLTEPASEAEYNAIVNQTITFDIVFTIA